MSMFWHMPFSICSVIENWTWDDQVMSGTVWDIPVQDALIFNNIKIVKYEQSYNLI